MARCSDPTPNADSRLATRDSESSSRVTWACRRPCGSPRPAAPRPASHREKKREKKKTTRRHQTENAKKTENLKKKKNNEKLKTSKKTKNGENRETQKTKKTENKENKKEQRHRSWRLAPDFGVRQTSLCGGINMPELESFFCATTRKNIEIKQRHRSWRVFVRPTLGYGKHVFGVVIGAGECFLPNFGVQDKSVLMF